MCPQLAEQDQMTIEEFLAFTETRPDDEKWELIEGVPVMDASPSNNPPDQAWRRKVYASIPNLQHYVTIALKSVIVVRHDRATGRKPVRHTALDRDLELPALGGAISMRVLYRDTPHAQPGR